MKLKKITKLLSLALVSAMLISVAACASNKEEAKSTQTQQSEASVSQTTTAEEKPDPLGKYAEPITIYSAFEIGGSSVAPEGMSATNNPWVKGWEKDLGIKVEYKFISNGDYDTKMNLLVTSGDLPDMFQVNAALFQDLVADDMLADLTDAYEKYASDLTKERFNQDGGLMAQNAIIDGKRLGLVHPVGYQDNINLIAMREDWLKQLNLEAPKNMGDLWNVAKAFKDAKLGGDKTIALSASKDLGSFRQLMNGYGAYYQIWLEKDGKLEYSTIQPEMKVAIGKLAEQYKNGLIDPEFGTKNMDKVWEDAVGGRSGIVLNDFCAPFRTVNGVKNKQEWNWYPVLTENGDMSKTQQTVAFNNCVVVSKKCKNPEAVMKLYNYFNVKNDKEPDTYSNNGILNFSAPFTTGILNKNNKIHEAYKKFIETGVMPNGDNDMLTSINTAEKYNKDKNMDGYIMWNIFGPEGTQKLISAATAKDANLVDKYTGAPTPSMAAVKSVLTTMEEEMITSIIMGSKPLDYFDEFVTNWKASGGDKITTEVNEWYQKQQAK